MSDSKPKSKSVCKFVPTAYRQISELTNLHFYGNCDKTPFSVYHCFFLIHLKFLEISIQTIFFVVC